MQMRATTNAVLRVTCLALGMAAGVALGLILMANIARAQDQFSPVITVDNAAITGFELDQRMRLLDVFRAPGDLAVVARGQLVEERLKAALLARDGLVITDAALLTAMEEFATRAELTLDQLLTVLGQNGVSEESLRDFVRAGVVWRDYVRLRFGDRVQISQADIDQALGQTGRQASGIEVLLSEIIIAAPPPRAAEAMAVARRVAQMTSFSAFESAAREYSALPSRGVGGRLGWLPIANYPAPLRPLLLALAPGEVTAPIQIEGGIALFQLRDVREVAVTAATPARLAYMVFTVPEGAVAAQAIAARVDVCDDLYGEAFGLPPERLAVLDQAPAEVAQDIALELAKLDPGESSTALARDGVSLLVMLCSRTAEPTEAVDRESVAARLRNQRLAGYAEALVAELRAAAVIVGE